MGERKMMRQCVPPVSECRQVAGSRNRAQDSVENGLMIHLLVPHHFSISLGGRACFIRATLTYASMI